MSHPIVTAARGWIGTRFHHQGRIKKTGSHKGGVDCLGLLAGVAAELDLRDADGLPLIAFDETDYAHRPDTHRLRARLSELLIEIPSPAMSAEALAKADCGGGLGRGKSSTRPGDIVLLRMDGSPQHLAIVSDWENSLGLIHAYAPARAVVEHALDDWWRERIEAAFRVG